MVLGRGTGDVPDLLEPLIKFSLAEAAGFALAVGWLPIPPRLALHQNELHVILDNRVRLVRFAEEFAGLVGLENSVGNLVPDDRVQVVETEAAAEDTDVRMQRKHQVPAKVPAGHADVANHANQATAGDQDAIHMPPDLGQLVQKHFIVLDVAELIRVFLIALKIPVGRRSDGKMHRFIRQEREVPGIAVDEPMNCLLHKVRSPPRCGRSRLSRNLPGKGQRRGC